MKYIIALLVTIGHLNASPVKPSVSIPLNLVSAIHQVETGGRLGAIKGDSGKALGPLQIHKAYWQDATQFDRTIGGSYSDCADYGYSVKIVNAYMRRYAGKYIAAGNWEAVARIHNGGLNGYNNRATIKYWNKVKRFL